jgi:hypothetical protein
MLKLRLRKTTMAQEQLATYLNDHLAGSVVALEMLEHLETVHSGDSLSSFFRDLRADVASDREELERLMKQLNIDQSRTRKASAWLTEKLTELKLRFDDPKSGALLLLESLEALSLGIEGKRSLWITLASISETRPSLRIADYHHLQQRAQEQRDRVEDLRIKTALTALTADG